MVNLVMTDPTPTASEQNIVTSSKNGRTQTGKLALTGDPGAGAPSVVQGFAPLSSRCIFLLFLAPVVNSRCGTYELGTDELW